MASRTKLSALLTLGALFAAWPVHAADADDSEPKADAADSADTAADDKAEKPAADADDKASKPVPDTVPAEGNSSIEDPSKNYYFVGLRYREIIVPSFILGLFADTKGPAVNGSLNSTTVALPSFGAEFAVRKAGFETNLALWWAGYGMDNTLFKGKSDGDDAWELIKSNISVLYVSGDFLWSHDFTPELALNYGLGAGLGLVFGDLHRNQAYPLNGQINGQWVKCPGTQQNPGGDPRYCDGSNNHYGNYTEKDWTGGGSKPTVFPWLALQTGLRYKPARNFVARLDAGFGLSGFFVGLGADYGL
jgi:hypothetical protein